MQDEDDEEMAESFRTLTQEERQVLSRLADAMETNRDQDPKCAAVMRLLVEDDWLRHGCIVFSQYYDSAWWLANELARQLPDETIGLYAAAGRSGLMRRGDFQPRPRDALKDAVRKVELRLLIGTDAASEGLNLQRLGARLGARSAKRRLVTELPNYWPQREALAAVLGYLAALEIDHWHQDTAAARLVAGAVENDHV